MKLGRKDGWGLMIFIYFIPFYITALVFKGCLIVWGLVVARQALSLVTTGHFADQNVPLEKLGDWLFKLWLKCMVFSILYAVFMYFYLFR